MTGSHPNWTLVRRVSLAACLLAASAVQAADGPTLQRSTYNKVEAAHKLMEQGRYDQALRDMRALLQDTKRDYDRAVILQTMAYAHVDENDYPAAIDAFERAIALDSMPPAPTGQLRRALGRLYAATDQHAKARDMLEAWIAGNDQADAADYAALASVYSQLKAYGKGIDAIRKAIRLQATPPQSHYQLLIAMCFESGRYAEAAEVLETLVRRWPDEKRYWTQLANVYINLDEHTKAHATLKLAYRKNLLASESELLNLVRVGMLAGVPDQAARVLDAELESGRIESNRENWALLAQAWSRARETDEAIRAYGKAAEYADDGRYQLRQAQLHMREGNWAAAAETAQAALERGGLESPGQADLLLGMARVRQERYEEALQAFGRAQRHDETANEAGKWARYAERRRSASRES